MSLRTRREVFSDIGKGMFTAALGCGLAADLGLAPAWAGDEPSRLTFGDLEPLVAYLQDTPANKMLPGVVEKLRTGTNLEQLVAAAALANARTFGGEDYVGFHTLMALPPAYYMALEETREDRKPLALLKVLYRNSTRLGERGGSKGEVLHSVTPGPVASSPQPGEQLRDTVRQKDLNTAEGLFAGISHGHTPQAALDQLMMMVDDGAEVHRIVLVWRSWDLIDFVGKERAHTLLRQSVHYCVKSEQNPTYHQEARAILPKVLDQYHLLGMKPGTKSADDAWVAKFADTLFTSTPAQAADAAAAAIAEGITADAITQAIALAANQLLLRDEGRPKEWTSPGKPVGSIHGDSIGVHACDSANAWRNLSRAGDRRTQVTSLILGAYQVARDRMPRAAEFAKWEPYPRAEHLEKVRGIPVENLLKELDGAIREKDQARAAALTHRIGQESPDRFADVFGLFRGFAVSEDGALHAEKYYRTTSEEFRAARPAFRWRQLVALSRVTASEYGQPAPGYKESCDLVKG
jgi:hypothetical protein